MDNVINQPKRIHPMMATAAASVTLVSLLGVAAITGLIPTSHGTAVPATAAALNAPAQAALVDQSVAPNPNARYVSPDGKLLQEVPMQRVQTASTTPVYEEAPVQRPAVVHHTTVHHAPVRHYQHTYAQNTYAQNTYSQPSNAYEQRAYQPQYAPQHPVVNYVNDMHPVGTGVGAVVGGLLGNQVGGGNGKKLATVAGVLMGGYAGNEIAHNRSPLPGQ